MKVGKATALGIGSGAGKSIFTSLNFNAFLWSVRGPGLPTYRSSKQRGLEKQTTFHVLSEATFLTANDLGCFCQ